MRRSRILHLAGALALYSLVVVWLTWPLATHLSTHLPNTKFICDIDLRQMIWALSWQTHALLTDPSRIFEANVYHPTPHALLYADAGAGALPYFLPIYAATDNPVLASNVMFLGCLALTASTLHLLVTKWTGLASAGFVASSTFLATPWVLWTWIPAAPNYAVLFMLPAIVYLGAQAKLSPGRGVLLAVLLVLQGAANPYYAAAVLASVSIVAGLRTASGTTRPSALRSFGAVALGALALLAVYAPYAWMRTYDVGLADRLTWKIDRLLPRFVPMDVPKDLFTNPRMPTCVPWPAWVLLGLGIVATSLQRGTQSDARRTAWRHGTAWTAVGLVLSLAPTIKVLGWTIALPWVGWIQQIPLAGALLDPFRIGVGALFGLSILAGVGFAECARWLAAHVPLSRSRVLRGIAAAVFFVASAGSDPGGSEADPRPARYPMAAASVPRSSITALLRERGGPVLQLPLGVSFVDQLAVHARAMFESIGHWQPLLNGYGGFYPEAFPERMRLARRLPEAAALAELRRSTGLEFVLVEGGRCSGPALARWEALAQNGGGDGLRFVARDGSDLIFAVSDVPPGPAS